MANKMLIDASHPEETRVVVLRGNRVEEFDFEAASKKPLRGNIYLAKVTRVEPSLQAAFIEYGGNRHGFLAFSEIHPDYYQIPVADRQALLAEEAASHAEEEEEPKPRRSRRRRGRDQSSAKRQASDQDFIAEEAPLDSFDSQDVLSMSDEDRPHEEPANDVQGASDADSADIKAPFFSYHQDMDGHTGHPSHVREISSGKDGVLQQGALLDQKGSSDQDGSHGDSSHDHGEDLDHHKPLILDADGYTLIEERDDADAAQHDGPDHGEKALRIAGRDDHHQYARSAPFIADDDEEEDDEEDEEEQVDQIGGDDIEEMPRRPIRSRRQYKIQEVIKRRQVLLVQVVKEERGNKGAAMTTYLSLAGRYSVLMPNTARGGGISRKITDSGDRKRLKTIAQDLEVPEGMGIILRTAGASRTRAEVKRDFEYLLRMWETVREMTLRSSAPTLVYEEGSLIKRAIRDLYNKDVDEVVVSGETGYREAKDFMRLLMPSHAKNVKTWREPQAVFVRYGVESQLDAMFSSQVTLRSGGYLVINQTEALVAIDVNSGRSTREHNIEDTALRTNLEAADEVARQLRLRDLAGLVVVDFIDMEEPRNNRAVERRVKDALKNDRARIQVGRISHFGLLEMSRQRIRSGVVEGSTIPCPHCAGAGMVRSTASIALHVMRVLEEALLKSASHNVIVKTRTIVALYILNQKRSHLRMIERRFGVDVYVMADETLTGSTYHALERGELATGTPEPLHRDEEHLLAQQDYENDIDNAVEDEVEVEEDHAAEEEDRTASDLAADKAAQAEGSSDEESDGEGQRKRRRRRRRRGRGSSEREDSFAAAGAPQPSDEGLAIVAQAEGDLAPEDARPSGRRNGFWARENSDRPEPFHAPDVETHSASEALEGQTAQPSVQAAPAAFFAALAPSGDAAEHSAHGQPLVHVDESQTITAPADSVSAHAGQMQHEPAVAAKHDAAPVEHRSPVPVAPETDAFVGLEPIAAVSPHQTDANDQIAQTPPIARAPTERVILEADPDRPKKGGWWQRAKASFTGN